MDANVAPDTLRAGTPLPRRPDISLPTEDEPAAADAVQQGELSPTRPARRGRRGGLLAAGAMIGTIAGGFAFALSPYNTIYPISLNDVSATARRAVESTGLIAPAARMAQAPAPLPAPSPARPSLPPADPAAQRDELMGLHPSAPRVAGGDHRPEGQGPRPGGAPVAGAAPSGVGATLAPVAQAGAGARSAFGAVPRGERPEAGRQPAEQVTALPAARPEMPVALAPNAIAPVPPPTPAAERPDRPPIASGAQEAGPAVGPATPPPVAPGAPREVVPATPSPASTAALDAAAPPPLAVVPPVPQRPALPHDPTAVAASMRAAPMAGPQQIEVLGLVTRMGVMMRDQREENRQLRQDVAAMREMMDGQLSDFNRRLSLAEARGALNAAMGAAALAPRLEGSAAAERPPARQAQAGGRSEERRRYRVQAASPGLAMLAEIDRSGEAGASLQISVGDEIPGYGRVQSIGQEGSAWIVRAERGAIQ